MLASVGAPPLSPMHPMPEDVPAPSGASRASLIDQATQRPSCSDDVYRALRLLERFTCRNVALIHRVDELVEWIRDATALRLFGTGRAPTPFRGPSVERVEQSAAERLMRQRVATQNDDTSSKAHRQLLVCTLESLPLSLLRRNVASVGLQQLHALFSCLHKSENALEENELDDESPYCQLDVPDVVTLSWIRSLRSDLVQTVYYVVDETLCDLIDCGGQPAHGSNAANDATRARSRNQAIGRAVSAAEEGLSFLLAYPHNGANLSQEEASANAVDGSAENADVSRRLVALQYQCDALTTALMTLQESIFSGSTPGVLQDNEPLRWWKVVRDLSSQISVEVEALDTDLNLSCDRGREDGASIGNSPPDDGHLGQSESSNGNAENEYVLVDSSCDFGEADGRDRCNGKTCRAIHIERRTLVYSGKGCVVRSPKPTLRPTAQRSKVASKHHEPPDPTSLYQSLYEELRGRLGMIQLNEVDASASLISQAVATDDETTDSNSTLSPEPLCGAERERISASGFLAELRGALQGDSAISEAGKAWGTDL
jgi:hypothetical protein